MTDKDALTREVMTRLFGDADQSPISAKVKISKRPRTRIAAALRATQEEKP